MTETTTGRRPNSGYTASTFFPDLYGLFWAALAATPSWPDVDWHQGALMFSRQGAAVIAFVVLSACG